MRLSYRSSPIDGFNVGRFYCVDLDLPLEEQCVGNLDYGRPGSARHRQYAFVAGWLVVNPGYQRQGIATELWRRFVAVAKGRPVFAEYSADGAAFMRSYCRRFGRIPGLRGGWEVLGRRTRG